MLLERLPMGKTLEIYVDRDGYRYRLVSKVEDTSTTRVCVTLIAAGSKVFKFLPTDKVRIAYRDEEQMWEWLNVSAGIAKLDNSPVHYFEIKDKGRSFNRRNAYRVPYSQETEIGYFQNHLVSARKTAEPEIEDDETSEMPEPKFAKVIIKDLSELGVGIYTDAVLELEDSFFFSIPSQYGPLESKATVIRKDKLTDGNYRYEYFYGCLFTQSSQKMSRVIMDVQREKLKRM